MKKKSDLIREIIKLTQSEGDVEGVDILADKTEKYLNKLIKVIKGL